MSVRAWFDGADVVVMNDGPPTITNVLLSPGYLKTPVSLKAGAHHTFTDASSAKMAHYFIGDVFESVVIVAKSA